MLSFNWFYPLTVYNRGNKFSPPACAWTISNMLSTTSHDTVSNTIAILQLTENCAYQKKRKQKTATLY